MPTRREILSVTLASAAFIALAVTAANLNTLETTKSDLGGSIAVARAATGVTVHWVTDYDPMLGGEKVVGATLQADSGSILADSDIDLTIVDAEGVKLGTISSSDGGASWSKLRKPVSASEAVVASVVIDDRATTAAVSRQ